MNLDIYSIKSPINKQFSKYTHTKTTIFSNKYNHY